MKNTVFHDKHVELGAKMVEFAGFHMPIQYTSILEEHQCVREHVGIFDVSHMGEILVTGQDAEVFLDYLLTNNMNSLEFGQCAYTMMCYENGTVVDDLLAYKYNTNKFLLVVNASNDDKDFEHIENLAGTYDVKIEHISEVYSELAIQGPKAEQLLQDILGEDVENIEFFRFAEIMFQNETLIVSRTGYTGEDGFEVFLPKGIELVFLDELLKHEIQPQMIGLGARDTLRFEVALPLYGHELSDQLTPVNAKLNTFVDYDKDFNGKNQLLAEKENDNRYVLIGFELNNRGIARQGALIYSENEEIGYVTTGYKLDGYEHAIGLGYVKKPYGSLGNTVQIHVRKKIFDATICKRKFYNKKYKK